MLLTTRVRLVLEEAPEMVLPGVKVSLYDRDIQDEDDLLGTEVTDAKGEALFAFDSDLYTDAEDQPEWRLESLPDFYVVIYDAQGRVVLSTRAETLRDNLPRLFTVPISRELVEKHKLVTEL